MTTRKQPQERTVLVRDRDLPGFLDMLRYDQCTVINWSRQETGNARGDLFEITLRAQPTRTPEYGFTDARWESFGLTLKEKVR